MLRMLIATLGMAAVGVLVWKLLQRQERSLKQQSSRPRDDADDGK